MKFPEQSWPWLFLLVIFPPWAAMANQLDWDAFVTYGDFESMKKAHETEFFRERLEGLEGECAPNFELRQAGFLTVAIDGGAGSGKTSAARALAEVLHFAFVSTGEHYRILTRLFLEKKLSPNRLNELEKVLKNLHPTTIFTGNGGHLSLDGRVIDGAELRSPEINRAISDYAALPCVRKLLHDYERNLPQIALTAGFSGLVVEGRDTTSVVFPDADLRVYLEVSLEERVRRRAREGVEDDVADRDRRDESQMELAEGVWHMECTDLTLDQVVTLLRERLEEMAK
jgi:cytidylate kinase